MARGWESKAVEDQQQEAIERERLAREPRQELSPEDRARQTRLETLKLSRTRTLEQLERVTNRAYRETLKRTLRALESEIEELS